MMKLDNALCLDWKALFPDWKEINPGEWSVYNRVIHIDDRTELEICLYREPIQNEEYANTLTLQVFINDCVIYLHQIKEDAE